MFPVQARDFSPLNIDKKGPPRVVVMVHEDGIREAYIVGDNVLLRCNGTDMCSHLVDLIACYFAWNLCYPKQYQLLGFVQTELLKYTAESFFQSTAYTKFMSEYRHAEV